MNDPTENNQAIETATPAADDNVTMTRAAYDSAMAASRRSGEAKAVKQVAAPTVAQAPSVANSDDLATRFAKYEANYEREQAQRAFDRVVASKHLSEAQSTRLFNMSQVEKPGDLAGWVDATIAIFGLHSAQVRQPAAAPIVVMRAFDIAGATDFIPWDALSPEQKGHGPSIRHRAEHNARVERSRAGSPRDKSRDRK